MNISRPIESDRLPWGMTATPSAQKDSEFDSVLLAMAGHDFRQPLQIIQSANDFLSRGDRTNSELRLLQSGQNAIDRLKEQLDQLVTALRVRERGEQVKLTPVHVGPLLWQAFGKNEAAALRKGISIRVVPTSASILSDQLLLGAVLGNMARNAVEYTQHGGSILLGCRRSGPSVRIDVYDTSIGTAEELTPRIFEAFTRLDSARRDSLGVGLFIVRRAIGILGHRIHLASTPSRGSRFSIFATRAE